MNGITLGVDGYLYGATVGGGTNGAGTIFRITPDGELTTLYNFCAQANCADGAGAVAVIQGAGGNLYGTTQGYTYNGTVFEMTSTGKLIWSYNFCSLPNCSDGNGVDGPVVQADSGDLYGTTVGGRHLRGTRAGRHVFQDHAGGCAHDALQLLR